MSPDRPVRPTVLLVEDEESLRKLVQMVLATKGYEVLAARDGAAAVELFRGQSRPLSLLITDLSLPDGNGQQLAGQFRQQQPDLKVLFISGYPASIVVEAGRTDALKKPFAPTNLLEAVENLLRS